MKTLNLVHKDRSNIPYKLIQYPDGQHQLTIEKFQREQLIEEVIIASKLTSWIDLEIISCAVAALRSCGVEKVLLFVPYVLGARSDRQFERGSSNYLKEVICPVINSLELSRVTVLDPHSNCLEMGIKNFLKISNSEFVKRSIKDLENMGVLGAKYFLASPDAGALQKIYSTTEEIEYIGGIIKGHKHRSAEGSILETGISYPLHFNPEIHLSRDIIIVDDICDGGRTFVEMAKALRKQGHTGKLFLMITHGIFSHGFDELSEYFDKICTTNSFGDKVDPNNDKKPFWMSSNNLWQIPSEFLIVHDVF